MTPTTSERDRFEAWAKDTMSLVKEPGGYKEATTHHAWRAWQAALTREQREGCPACGRAWSEHRMGYSASRCKQKPQQEAPAITQCPKCDCWFEPPGTPTSLPNGSLLKSMTVQQEAPGAVAFQHKWDDAGETCVHCGDKDWMGDKCSGPRTATPPAPVDVRKPMSRFIELLAQLVNAPQTDDEFDAEVLRREVVMEKVMQLRAVWDDLSKAHRALLDGQPAGVERG